jgi:hypothetical protein
MFSRSLRPTIGTGHATRSQLLWEPLLFELTMMATSLLLYRDKNGMTIQGRIARKLRSSLRFRLGQTQQLTRTGPGWRVAPPERSC